MKKLISLLVIFVFAVVYLIPSSAFGNATAARIPTSPYSTMIPVGEEAVSPMKKGQRAPFAGILYSTAAAAKVQVELENADSKCEIEKTHELDKEKAKHELTLANERAAKESLQLRLDEILKIKNDQILFLTKEIERNEKKRSRDWGALYFASGVVGGILLMAVSAYAYREINK